MKKIYVIIFLFFLFVSFSSAQYGDVEKSKLKDGKEWAYSLTFDDSKKSVYTNAYPILNKYEYTAGIGVVTKRAYFNNDYFLNWTDLHVLYDSGWGILSHSESHFSATDSTKETIEFELNKSKQEIEKNFLSYSVEGFIYPYGDIYNPDVLDLVKIFYNFGEVSYLSSEFNNVDTVLEDSYLINRKNIYGNASKYNSRFDRASIQSQTEPLWLIEYTHGVDTFDRIDSYDTEINSLDDHLNYLNKNYGGMGTNEVWIAPSNKVFDYIQVWNNTIIENKIISDDKIEFFVNMSKVSNEVADKVLTLRIYTDSNSKILFNLNEINFTDKGNYLEFNAKEGNYQVIRNNSSQNGNNSGNQTNPKNEISPKINLSISNKEIQFNGWTNVSWNVENADSSCIKITNPIGGNIYSVCNSSGSLKLKAADLYYAGNYTITIEAKNEIKTQEFNSSFKVKKWSEREKNLPILLLNKSKDILTKNDSIKISWDSFDDNQIISSYIYVVDEPYAKLIYQSYSQNGDVVLEAKDLLTNGSYKIYFRAKDSANNWNYINQSFAKNIIG
ncbi:MAG: polysaccharide deacetylase family protein [Candidatus Pacearchaeota archaeon]